jgi:branched-chain amino acid transport system permease protein
MNPLNRANGPALRKVALPAVVVLALIAFGFSPVYASSYTIVLFNTIVMYIILSVSWNVFSGPTGYISLATAAFYGLGIYVSALFGTQLPLPVLMLAGGLVSAALALIVGMITLRLRSVYFTIFTFALIELLKNLILWYEVKFNGTRGRTVIAIDTNTVFFCMFALLALTLLASFLIRRSRIGMALVGIGECEDAAAHIGVNTTFVKALTFAGTSFAMGAVGAAKATTMIYIDPPIAFNMLMSFMPVLMAIFGGANTWFGPILGAVVFTLLQEKLITRYPQWYMIVFGVIMILAILFLPNGLVGLAEKFRFRGKEAKAHADS